MKISNHSILTEAGINLRHAANFRRKVFFHDRLEDFLFEKRLRVR